MSNPLTASRGAIVVRPSSGAAIPDSPPPPSWSSEAVERMRLRLIRSEQLAAVGGVVACLAHEINNPLSALLGSIEIMQEIITSPQEAATGPNATRDELRGLLLDCATMVDRIRELMNAVRGMSRADEKEAVVFDPLRAIRDATRVFAIARRGRCHVDLSLQAVPAIMGSPGRLGQVVLNLLQNGVDASTGEARLLVTAETIRSEVRITVADHGTGIPAEIGPHVFEAFFTSKGVDKGTGLGLYICRELVTGMGGTIGFETSATGTTFRIDLPAYCPERVR